MQIYKELEDDCKGFKELHSLITNVPTLEQDQQEGSQGMKQAQAEAAALREENAALKAALEQARQERKAQGGESLTPQQKAAQVRSETALAAWKSKIGAMVKVAVQIGKEGPKERQAGDFYAYFNELDVDLTNEQMKVFRTGVPDEYKDTVGGKAGKT